MPSKVKEKKIVGKWLESLWFFACQPFLRHGGKECYFDK